MMQKEETKFSKRLVAILESQCAFVVNLHGHAMQRRGLPDLEIIHRKWHGFLELKCGENKTSAIQKKVAADIKSRCCPAFVLRCVGSKETFYSYALEDFDGMNIRLLGTGKPALECLLDILVDLRIETLLKGG